VNITGAEGANDHLTVHTLGGNDVVDASGLAANLIGLTVDLGDGQGDANTRFVEQLYQDLLGRQADAAGLAGWLAALDQGMTREQVAAGIENSTESLTDVVQKAYQQFLHRAGDQAGVTGWVNFLQAGHTIEQMEAGIIGSPEYFQVRGGGTNNGFLAALYQDALNRGIDAGGQAGFGTALANGATTGQIAAAVLSSPEGIQDEVQGFYRDLLGRPADSAGLNGFVNALQHGATDQQVIAAIAGSDEFFARLR
jgi:acylphosphatase